MSTYLVTLSRYQRVTVEVEAKSKADAENEVIREYEDGEIDEFDWTVLTYDVLRCEKDVLRCEKKEERTIQ